MTHLTILNLLATENTKVLVLLWQTRYYKIETVEMKTIRDTWTNKILNTSFEEFKILCPNGIRDFLRKTMQIILH